MIKGHPFLPNSVPTVEAEMLRALKIKAVEDLFADIPENVRLGRRLSLPGPYPEATVKRKVERLLGRNSSAQDIPMFLGGGVWPHYVPAAVEEVVGRTEFSTSYTPYQAEISQGMLQALFEYQSLIVELTEMDYANCSMYDWASALGEAALMASRVTHRSEVLIPHYLSPDRRSTLETYIQPSGLKSVEIKSNPDDGLTDVADLKEKLNNATAAVYVENPAFLGQMETHVDEVSELAHENESLLIAGVDPISLGILKAPGDYGADIAIGEGQPLGLGMNYGGPALGIFACRGERLLRQMPGRIIGCTSTLKEDRRAFCMTLQTREQHIRREKATSNICTNNALCAVAAATYLSLLGPAGLKDLCKTILVKVNHTLKRLSQIRGVEAPLFKAYHFKEFTAKFDTDMKLEEINRRLIGQGVHGGIDLGNHFSELRNTTLLCVTEMHMKEDVERLVTAIENVVQG